MDGVRRRDLMSQLRFIDKELQMLEDYMISDYYLDLHTDEKGLTMVQLSSLRHYRQALVDLMTMSDTEDEPYAYVSMSEQEVEEL